MADPITSQIAERRTDAPLLRAGLDAVRKQVEDEHKEGAFVLVANKEYVQLGAAWIINDRWELSGALRANVAAGKARDVTVMVQATWGRRGV